MLNRILSPLGSVDPRFTLRDMNEFFRLTATPEHQNHQLPLDLTVMVASDPNNRTTEPQISSLIETKSTGS